MTDLTEALAEWEGLDIIQSTGDEAYGVLLAAARRWDALDSDENVEAAAKAVVRVAGTGLGEDGYVKVWVDQHAEIMARAALRAVKAGGHDGAD